MSAMRGKVLANKVGGLRLACKAGRAAVRSRGLESTRTTAMSRRQRNAARVWAAASGGEEGVDMENIEVVEAAAEEEEHGSASDLEEVIYSLDKSASVASLMSVIEQKFADQLDPAFMDDGVDGEDYEKHAENMRNKVKSLGMEERLIEVRRVTKVVKGGNILSFRAIVAVGNKKGKIAVGVGKGKEVMPATTKAVAEALRDVVEFPLAKNDSIPHTTVGSATSASVILKPAGEGTGVIAGGATRTVLELAGVENVLSKQLGSDSLLNNARATVNALAKLRSPVQVAQLRGKTVRQLFGLDDVTKKVDTIDVSAERLQELIQSCDTKTQTEIGEGLEFLKEKGFEPEAAEAQVNAI
ncbi:plastid ribosomal protein S5 [Chloropicon primus]|uniref:Small ribosomal subunit protein uS5c n=1 Tax=Chloropicon primus TaxID=1764295 RepID=A0A5B8MKZ9_9CHLO|nr:plastid ribosomal protein S5 [Chloropicon primus]UPQ99926.1 plastid ribosomal protein S5 [Chloropicon primus]|mmetsp:Transcript_40351/g.86100  ORF Transcript_40351/g.86100 Transcript_40351/m.86100 type:complete len:356 (+) Transcript_40351:80-1147(+)|eukprot:QDZ20714.1 plastid ribosomal protein S5 [Chloropicon primus]